MERKKLTIEYPLTVRSANLVWGLIAQASGLARWFADDVTEEGESMIFTWGESWMSRDVRRAHIVERRRNSHIRLRWEQDEDETEFLEMRIEESELTGNLRLRITDFADADEEDSLRDLWNGNLARLHSASGL